MTDPAPEALSFRNSTKHPEAEEDIDLFVHRPIAYVFARAFAKTPVTPNQVTFMSGAVGVVAGVLFAIGRPWSLLAGGLCTFLSTVLDCADGQLARMKGVASPMGRVYDGATDNVVGFATFFGAAIYVVTRQSSSPFVIAYLLVALAFGNWHTMLFDYYRQCWLLMVLPDKGEFEDLETVKAHLAQLRADKAPWIARLAVSLQLKHHTSQASTAKRMNPANFLHREEFPYTPEGAEHYRARHTRLLRVWSFFGPGWHFFMLALAGALGGQFIWYLHYRVILLNVVIVFLIPLQRRATRETAQFLEAHGARRAVPEIVP